MPQTTQDILDTIQQADDNLLSKMFNSLIREHRKEKGDREKKLYDRYIQDKFAVPILTRQKANSQKINEKLANDFYGDIVDTKTGYMGNEITVDLKKDNYYTIEVDEEGEKTETLNEQSYDNDQQKLKDFGMINTAEDLNSEAIKMASICGWVPRLLYLKKGENDARIMNMNPWEVIMIYDSSIHEPEAVMRYYEMDKTEFADEAPFELDKKSKIIYIEWYDEKSITYYIGEKENPSDDKYKFRLDVEKMPGGKQTHLFTGIPIVPLLNNEESKAEPEKAISLIDAYDTIMSDTTSEIEQLRLSYMWVRNMGGKVTDQFLERLEQTGVFPLPADGEVGFAQKTLDDSIIQNTLTELRKNIYQFSKSIDLSQDMGGDMRVIGWQVNLLNLENSCKVTERKFTKGLREQYRMLTDFWRRFKNGVNIEYLDLEFVFNRNFPKNIADEAKTLIDLVSVVSRKTAYSLMSFIDDPDKELEAWEQEKEANAEMYAVGAMMEGEEEEETEEEE